MTSKAVVDDFLAQRTLALVGASRDPKAFSVYHCDQLHDGFALDSSGRVLTLVHLG